jgi:hypothetical protein
VIPINSEKKKAIVFSEGWSVALEIPDIAKFCHSLPADLASLIGKAGEVITKHLHPPFLLV